MGKGAQSRKRYSIRRPNKNEAVRNQGEREPWLPSTRLAISFVHCAAKMQLRPQPESVPGTRLGKVLGFLDGLGRHAVNAEPAPALRVHHLDQTAPAAIGCAALRTLRRVLALLILRRLAALPHVRGAALGPPHAGSDTTVCTRARSTGL
eukprot:1236444-Pleurochrysis_carterae.AAC.2